ncbi:hypothetical protein COU23_00730 [Candidatus Kuenenbacteria bacterium CG10_big_fil_rev_8_21_14_0_10_36_11]|uniref:TraC-like domain-containing protein n=1 Tax=Candidatus Kuenenbacteria bacterium CG10_big_fil_rev_8_21_14_0_10_36_11 TaxID=1974618 RepID=A0A2M6WB50_9BACT|nr:MAG: hypothetical protein COU23_00730 [Candidatus Kuenenbacteria bacterium CG10_big_fil_rev_8_21_14_0_10_36_11]
MSAKPSLPSTQQYLDIAEIRDGVVVMRDGSMRAVLLVSSINFALKSEEEQEATIQSYVNFLNYLDHPLQIVVQSRQLNIEKYLNDLSEREKKQTNELLRMQTADYQQFVKELVELGEIMSKRFYVIVPYSPGADKTKSFLDRLAAIFSPLSSLHLKEKKFRELKQELDKRTETVLSGLTNMGLSAVVLDTQALIELYYNSYNPEVAEQEKLAEVGELRIE